MSFALGTVGATVHFGGIFAANDVSLRVAKGARHALIGPNGAGKTTLINLLTGVLQPSAGRIILEGRDITDLPPHRRVALGLTRTFQIYQLFGDLTPLETIGLAVSENLGAAYDWWRVAGTRHSVDERIVEILERFHLADVMLERTAILPYGKQRLLEIAVAIACRPKVLLLDEPLEGLAPIIVQELLAALTRITREEGLPTIIVEQNARKILAVTDRSVILDRGSVVHQSDSQFLRADRSILERFLGVVANPGARRTPH